MCRLQSLGSFGGGGGERLILSHARYRIAVSRLCPAMVCSCAVEKKSCFATAAFNALLINAVKSLSCKEDPGNEAACVGGKLHTTSATAGSKTYPPVAYIWKLLLRQRKNKPCARQAEREFVHVIFRQTLNKSMKYSIIIINHNYKPV